MLLRHMRRQSDVSTRVTEKKECDNVLALSPSTQGPASCIHAFSSSFLVHFISLIMHTA